MLKKRIPYGISNFEMLREEGYIYVDKTKYIEILEELPPYQFFIRPRRFGKSLFISTLENYYDINKKDKFEALFNGLYIGQNPTPNKNNYLVLKLSFASLVTSEGKDKLIQEFDQNVCFGVEMLVETNKDLLEVSCMPDHIKSSQAAIRYISGLSQKANKKLMVLIDEYDNFANDLIGTGNKRLYNDLLSSEGYVRAFYKALKDGTNISIARVFMTGVSPIMLDDLTSGFNITTNLTLESELNEMVGFTQKELERIVEELQITKGFELEKVFEDMRKYYNGYMFSENSTTRLYNSDMVLYFLKDVHRNGKYPRNILDNNVKTDYRKLRELAFNFKDEETVARIIEDEELPAVIVDRFRLEDMYTNKENFISLLYYMGMLTIKRVDKAKIILGIPNYVVKTIYWEYFFDKLKRSINIENNRLGDAIAKMREQGDIGEFIAYLKEVLEGLSNRDLIRFDEKYIKIIIITLLGVDKTYIINSEYETEKGYIDIFLEKSETHRQYTNYEWVIELKYIKEENRNTLEQVKSEGLLQLQKYGESKGIKQKGQEVKKALVVVIGKSDVECII